MATVGQLQLAIAFDDKIKEIATIKRTDDPKNDVTKSERRTFYKFRTFLVFFYFLVVPYCQTPGWCLQYYKEHDMRHFGLFDCDAVSQETGIRYSPFPTFSPLLTVIIDIFCLIGFCFMSHKENAWRNQTKSEKR